MPRPSSDTGRGERGGVRSVDLEAHQTVAVLAVAVAAVAAVAAVVAVLALLAVVTMGASCLRVSHGSDRRSRG